MHAEYPEAPNPRALLALTCRDRNKVCTTVLRADGSPWSSVGKSTSSNFAKPGAGGTTYTHAEFLDEMRKVLRVRDQWAAIAGLPRSDEEDLVHREIIDLAYYQDKPINEVAEILGVPENTVKTRMFHARRRLSELLAQAGIDRTYQ